jgi:hypothetical protein
MYIACPRCDWRPQGHEVWSCTCHHRWHTFDTHGVCPKCSKAWKVTQCLECYQHSDHEEWYHDEDSPTVEEFIQSWQPLVVPVENG